MKQLEKLIIEAKILTEPEAEVERVMQVCNACRYCEGFCAVFPAMTQRLEFGKADINYLANLCHNCGACLHACQYAPPHEFAINVPKAMAEVRLETYQHYAQPAAFGALYRQAGVTVTLALVFSLILFLLLAMGMKGSLLHPPLAGDFYQIFPHNLLAWMFGSVFMLAIGLLMAGVIRFWREISHVGPRPAEIAEASHNALTLKYLDGGHGKGCNEADDAFTLMRRRFHHFTFYGFMLCFAATVVATGYHYFAGWEAPYPTLRPLIGGTLNIKHVRAHWDDILRLASSIKQGTVTASLMLRKLGSYPRQNGLAVALRELGRIERTLFILDWLQSVELRRRVHAGLNKGEARNSLARAVFFNRLGEIRDRSFEQQRYRASGLNLVTAAIVLWNTVYLERATQGLVEAGKPVDGELLQFLSPLGWEHINLTGDYVWRQSRRLEDGKFRPLRMPGKP